MLRFFNGGSGLLVVGNGDQLLLDDPYDYDGLHHISEDRALLGKIRRSYIIMVVPKEQHQRGIFAHVEKFLCNSQTYVSPSMAKATTTLSVHTTLFKSPLEIEITLMIQRDNDNC